jgi:putative SOS response-associated peptidase YedK
MPVILARDAYGVWLDPTIHEVERLQSVLVPYAAEKVTAYPVSTRVNNPANDTPECIVPLA